MPSVKIVIVISPDGHGVTQGTTWGHRDGFPAMTRIRLGQHTTVEDFPGDWTTPHELIHTAFADMPDDQHWLEEGIATYVEPLARAQAGQMPVDEVWQGMVAGLPNGLPAAGDRGLNRTHTWGRTYWGGALFCLMADIEIRKQTHNTEGLQDALRGIVAAGATIDKEMPVETVLKLGDDATKTTVLQTLYSQWSTTPVPIDLPALWAKLGVRSAGGRTIFDDHAPLADLRLAITKRRSE